jgi:spore cortex formation protein SpoVR/YcgB (stage V sporulation)
MVKKYYRLIFNTLDHHDKKITYYVDFPSVKKVHQFIKNLHVIEDVKVETYIDGKKIETFAGIEILRKQQQQQRKQSRERLLEETNHIIESMVSRLPGFPASSAPPPPSSSREELLKPPYPVLAAMVPEKKSSVKKPR